VVGATEERRAPTPHRHPPEAARMAPCQCGRRDQRGVKGAPQRIGPREGMPEGDNPHPCPRLLRPGAVGLGLAEAVAVGLMGPQGEAPQARAER